MSYALITGATKGIGKAFAEELAKRKFNLVLVARSVDLLKSVSEELEKKYGIKCNYFVADLAAPSSPERVIEWVQQNNLDVSVLINNAGYTIWSEFEKSNITEQLNMLEVNMLTPVKLSYLMLPLLRKQAKSYLLNVASTAAYQAIPNMSTYAASKAFIILFTRSLRLEYKGTNVSVTCLSPGTTDTDFMNRAKMDALKETAAKFNMKPEVVAKIAIDGMFKGKAEIIPGFVNWISTMMTYFVPKAIPEKVASNLYKMKK